MNIDSLHIQQFSFETTGFYNQLHFHAIVEVHDTFRPDPYKQWGDSPMSFQLHWDYLKNIKPSIDYIYKDTMGNYIKQQQILTQNYYKNYYFNQDTQKFKRLSMLCRVSA